jgi:hypothetical protein
MNFSNYVSPANKVKLCRKDLCIEASGQNARMLIAAICFAVIYLGLAALVNANK